MMREELKQVNVPLDDKTTVRILYTNYRGETAVRQIVPKRVWYGSTEWHPEDQWLLDAVDLEKNALRAFALKDVRAWF
jgi:predicted DNA-binding transcriptional regulator YafY